MRLVVDLAFSRRLVDLSLEQQRVRENLQAIPAAQTNNPADPNQKASRELTKRYLDKLSSLESELEALRQQIADLRQEQQKTGEQFEEFLRDLVAE